MKSLSIFVGSGQCNANCSFCAGKPIRKHAPKDDGILDSDLIYRTLVESHGKGARYLSISSSGEPTLSPLSVTLALEIVKKVADEGRRYSPVNLYTNGIRIGEDEGFASIYLGKWKRLGLSRIYLTIHGIREEENAKAFGVKRYPSLDTIIYRIKREDLSVRANMVLTLNTIGDLERYIEITQQLISKGVDKISSWAVRDKNDSVDRNLAPSEKEMDKIAKWINQNDYQDKIRLLREKDRRIYDDEEKMTLFPDGRLSNSWCR